MPELKQDKVQKKVENNAGIQFEKYVEALKKFFLYFYVFVLQRRINFRAEFSQVFIQIFTIKIFMKRKQTCDGVRGPISFSLLHSQDSFGSQKCLYQNIKNKDNHHHASLICLLRSGRPVWGIFPGSNSIWWDQSIGHTQLWNNFLLRLFQHLYFKIFYIFQ